MTRANEQAKAAYADIKSQISEIKRKDSPRERIIKGHWVWEEEGPAVALVPVWESYGSGYSVDVSHGLSKKRRDLVAFRKTGDGGGYLAETFPIGGVYGDGFEALCSMLFPDGTLLELHTASGCSMSQVTIRIWSDVDVDTKSIEDAVAGGLLALSRGVRRGKNQ